MQFLQLKLKQEIIKNQTLQNELQKMASLCAYYKDKVEQLAGANQQAGQCVRYLKRSLRQMKRESEKEVEQLVKLGLEKRDALGRALQKEKGRFAEKQHEIQQLRMQKTIVLKDAATLATINDKLRKTIQQLQAKMLSWRQEQERPRPSPKTVRMQPRRPAFAQRSIQTSQLQTRAKPFVARQSPPDKRSRKQNNNPNACSQSSESRVLDRILSRPDSCGKEGDSQIKRLVDNYEDLVKRI